MNSRIHRLGAIDLMFLRLETQDWPCHFGGLAIVEGGPLLDARGRLRLREVSERLERRLSGVPELRRRVHFPGVLRGRAVWVDDEHFQIANHVREAAVEAPGEDVQLLETAARVYATLLERERPLWELWFLTGLSEGRVGVLLKLHHAVADGLAAVRVMTSLFDFEADAPEPPAEPWTPEPVPGGRPLLAENLSSRLATAGRAAGRLGHPLELARGTARFLRLARHFAGRQQLYRDFGLPVSPWPATLNRPVRAGRRIRFLRLPLEALKETAHAEGGKLNDAVLDLWLGGLRRLLEARGEDVGRLELIMGVPVALRASTDAKVANRAGTMVLPLPLWEPDPRRRLQLVAQRTRQAKETQRPAAIMGGMARLSATRIGRYYTARQRASNLITSNVPGPQVPVYVLGARILAILPILQLVGNVGLTVCAFSYAGDVFLTVTADRTSFPDLDTLMAGMEEDWKRLAGARAPLRAGASA